MISELNILTRYKLNNARRAFAISSKEKVIQCYHALHPPTGETLVITDEITKHNLKQMQ